MSDNLLRAHAAAAAAAGLYNIGHPDISKLVFPQMPNLKRPLASLNDHNLHGFPNIKRQHMSPQIQQTNPFAKAAAIAAHQAGQHQLHQQMLANHSALPTLPPTPVQQQTLSTSGHESVSGTPSSDSDIGRMPHRLIEKKRRDRINSCINTLRDLLPESIKKATNRPLEKAIVLELSIDYIKKLQESSTGTDDSKTEKEIKKEALESEEETASKIAVSYERGWTDCSRAISELLQSKNSQLAMSLPTPPKLEASSMVFKNISNDLKLTKEQAIKSGRVPSGTGSEGYASDECERKSNSKLTKSSDTTASRPSASPSSETESSCNSSDHSGSVNNDTHRNVHLVDDSDDCEVDVDGDDDEVQNITIKQEAHSAHQISHIQNLQYLHHIKQLQQQ